MRRVEWARRAKFDCFALFASAAIVIMAGPASVRAGDPALPEGTKSIIVTSASGETLKLGDVTFGKHGDARSIAVKLDAPQFQEQFLSMRPFRCVPGTKQMWCHLDYPYPLAGRITKDDLADLEYRLMFLWRTYDRVGADAWNGLYFKLALEPDGRISGQLHEADYNVLASPPAAGVTRPVTHADLTPAGVGQHLYDRIEIK